MKSKQNYFAYKNDEPELVELGQFLRDVFRVCVKREWFILFDKETDQYIRMQNKEPTDRKYKYRCPDLAIFHIGHKKSKNVITDKPLLCHEVDGTIHKLRMSETMDRNEQYKRAKIELTVTDKLSMSGSIFNDAYEKIRGVLEGK